MKQGALFLTKPPTATTSALTLPITTAGCIAASAWRYSQAASGSRPAWSTATTGILRVSAPRT